MKIWKDAIEVTLKIYPLTGKDSFSRDFALKEQIRKALISITSNIAEGFEKNNNKDFIRFLYYSKGSAGEVRSQLFIANKLGYITDTDYQSFKIFYL
ncbi:MAG: four helix bundle protein [Bacteroidia bacterium]